MSSLIAIYLLLFRIFPFSLPMIYIESHSNSLFNTFFKRARIYPMAFKLLNLPTVLSLLLLHPLLFSASAANCNTAQPRREGDPSGDEISAALRGSNDVLLDTVCNGGFPPGSNTIATFNTGSVIYNSTRADENQPSNSAETLSSTSSSNASQWATFGAGIGNWAVKRTLYTTNRGQNISYLPS